MLRCRVPPRPSAQRTVGAYPTRRYTVAAGSYRAERLKIWERAKAQQQPPSDRPIEIKLPNGSLVQGRSGVTTPLSIATGISKGLADETIVARLNGTQIWDAMRPLEANCSLELLKWNPDNKIAQKVFWHSSAHLLGNALELHYPDAQLCDGPALDQGFFYELGLAASNSVSNAHFPVLADLMKKLADARLPFERVVLPRELAREMFAHNPYKIAMLDNIPANELVTAYKCGDFIDLCRGPHIPNTGLIRAVSVEHTSAVVFGSGATKKAVQRVHAITFPQAKLLKEYQTMRAEAAKRDHRAIGKAQGLFMFHPWAPGSPFFLPHGARVYNKLVNFMRNEYRQRGYQEVITPVVYNQKLWETSGHWQHYKDNMFAVRTAEEKELTEAEKKEQMGLKPMNCPGHCLIFEHGSHSYRDLPLRLADFGMLHRNELTGALTGLTRVIRFQQDDAHIFCTEDQLYAEIKDVLGFVNHVYSVFGFPFHMKLSTRPDSYMGELDLWNKAEAALRRALDELHLKYDINEGDGAFYGPKIDVDLTDAIGRKHQCATVQLDFQLPRRFSLSYVTDSGEKKPPVMIHRAIFGSLERMLAVLIEHTGGKWPFWLSPRQAVVVPVSEDNVSYAQTVRDKLQKEGFYVDADTDAKSTLQKKIREAQMAQYNFILVVGKEEQASETVNVRTRDNAVHGAKSVAALTAELHALVAAYR